MSEDILVLDLVVALLLIMNITLLLLLLLVVLVDVVVLVLDLGIRLLVRFLDLPVLLVKTIITFAATFAKEAMAESRRVEGQGSLQNCPDLLSTAPKTKNLNHAIFRLTGFSHSRLLCFLQSFSASTTSG